LGTANSTNGDVTGHHGLSGTPDIWLVKLSATGSKQWQRSLGGNAGEDSGELLFTADGGYLIAAKTHSVNTGDVIGGHSIFSDDVWIVKTNAFGVIEWQKVYGGTEDELAYAVVPTDDGGFMVTGSANSTDFDVTGNHGENDFWILKLDGSGNLEWQKSIGGSNDDIGLLIQKTTDGNLIIAGTSESNDGDASGHHGANTTTDFWVMKTDMLANIIWQKSYGGSENEIPNSLQLLPDGGFTLSGVSYSNDGDVAGHYGSIDTGDYWIMRIDADGNLLWERSLGGTDSEYSGHSIPTSDGGFALCGRARSTDYDVTFSHGQSDLWVVKLLPECIPAVETCNTLDDNCNGLIDDGIVETISISAGGPTIFCQGGSVLLTATYSGTTLQWKKDGVNIPGATNPTYTVTKKATYTCTTSSPCGTATSTGILVNVQKNPAASITAGGATTFCAGGSVTLNEAPVGGSTYQWYKGASAIVGATTTSYVATTAGNYKCRVTKTASGCFKNSNVITVTVPCRENESITNNSITDNSLTIYPNPNNGTFSITENGSPLERGGGVSVEIYNAVGQLIYSKELNSTNGIINETVELKNIPGGIYLVRLSGDAGAIEQKLIIQ